jgi:hypothetical protein
MSTNGIIARKTPSSWRGRYHHWDSNPEQLGKTLFALANGHFKGQLKKMMHVLVDEHKSWSTINGKDFNWPPQYVSPGSTQSEVTEAFNANVPQCHCHGERHDKGYLATPLHEPHEWAYVVDVKKNTMGVLWGSPEKTWVLVKTVAFAEAEPDWSTIECGEKLDRCSHIKSYHDKGVCPGCDGTKHRASSGHSKGAQMGDCSECVPCEKLPEPLRTYYFSDKHTPKKGWHCWNPRICDLCGGTGVQTPEQRALRQLISAELRRQYKAKDAAEQALLEEKVA